MTERDEWYLDDEEEKRKPIAKVVRPPTGYEQDLPKPKGKTVAEVMADVEATRRAALRAKLIGFAVAVVIAALTVYLFRPR